jgi:hypothetical protein
MLALRRSGRMSQQFCCARQQMRDADAASSTCKTHGSPKTNL